MFKAVEVEATSKRRTGREFALDAATRQGAIDLLLGQLNVAAEQAQVDPTRTLVHIGSSMWTLVAVGTRGTSEAPSLRRAGAKHKRVR